MTGPMALHPLGRITIHLGEVQAVGAVALGQRRVSLIAGGRAEGALLAGDILPGGSDWQLIRGDGVVEIDARYVIRLDRGGLVTLHNHGFRHGPPEVMAALGRGETIADDLYYFGSVIRFDGEVAPALSRTVVVATGARAGDQVILDLSAYSREPLA
jgi:hypothetical protein